MNGCYTCTDLQMVVGITSTCYPDHNGSFMLTQITFCLNHFGPRNNNTHSSVCSRSPTVPQRLVDSFQSKKDSRIKSKSWHGWWSNFFHLKAFVSEAAIHCALDYNGTGTKQEETIKHSRQIHANWVVWWCHILGFGDYLLIFPGLCFIILIGRIQGIDGG